MRYFSLGAQFFNSENCLNFSENCNKYNKSREIILGVKLNSRCFSMKTKSLFIVYGTLYFIQSIVLQKQWPLLIFHVTNGLHASRNPWFLRRSIHRSIFRYLQKIWNAMMTNDSEWLETNDNQMALCPVNMELRIPNSYPVYIFLRVLLDVNEHFHRAKLVCHDICRSLVACFSMLGSVSSIVFYSEQLWLFHLVSAPGNTRAFCRLVFS